MKTLQHLAIYTSLAVAGCSGADGSAEAISAGDPAVEEAALRTEVRRPAAEGATAAEWKTHFAPPRAPQRNAKVTGGQRVAALLEGLEIISDAEARGIPCQRPPVGASGPRIRGAYDIVWFLRGNGRTVATLQLDCKGKGEWEDEETEEFHSVRITPAFWAALTAED